MPTAAPTVFILPGRYNSGPEHWQTHWERERKDCRRIEQAEWNTPRREDWVATLERALTEAPRPVVLVAHSLACILVAHWAAAHPASHGRVLGALLVAPSDTRHVHHPGPRHRCLSHVGSTASTGSRRNHEPKSRMREFRTSGAVEGLGGPLSPPPRQRARRGPVSGYALGQLPAPPVRPARVRERLRGPAVPHA